MKSKRDRNNRKNRRSRNKKKPAGLKEEKDEFDFHEKFVFRNLPSDMTEEEFMILLERAAGVKKPAAVATKIERMIQKLIHKRSRWKTES